ncbi:hypothetical protein [Caulobacter phage Cr30]|uniref:hypothetical protein n=1 Tax=Caulobacter phage Cr30 TaxID=1357714 RepID=UPI0004A9B584|nr:hypothetical protein OZ74_gp208 [Caulobacter phage Cr30]AGS81135.1 hypothetical protein [Caulobacter phage Cr30]
MALPKIETAIFETVLPSNGKKVKFKQFSVKEEKILLIAEQSNETNDIVNAIKQILSNCIISEIELEKLPMFDLEWLFLQLRMKSVGEIVEFKIQDFEDEKIIDLQLNLEDVKMEYNQENNIIQLDENNHIKLRCPGISEFEELINFNSKNPNHTIALVASIIEQIYSNDEIIDPSSITKEELEAWVETFPKNAMLKIEQFFEKLPKLYHEIHYKNSLGNDRKFVLEGLKDFFL